MASIPHILNYLGSINQNASPQQLADMREYAFSLLPKGERRIESPWQGAGDILRALGGRVLFEQTHGLQADNARRAVNQSFLRTIQPQRTVTPTNTGITPTQNAARLPATIRNNNPGGMRPHEGAKRFGMTGSENLADGNKIATFDSPKSGAAAMFGLLNGNLYNGKSLADVVKTWSGGNNSDAYLQKIVNETGLSPDTIIDANLLASDEGLALTRSMSNHETGGNFPLDENGWKEAQTLGLGNKIAQPVQVADASGAIVPTGAPEALEAALTASNALRPVRVAQQSAQPVAAQPSDPSSGASNNNGFNISLPPVAPPMSGLSPDEFMDLQHLAATNPDAYKVILAERERMYTPVVTKVTGGQYWQIPGTGQRGFIPEVIIKEIKAADSSINAATTIDAQGNVNTQLLTPGANNNILRPGAPQRAPQQNNIVPQQNDGTAPQNGIQRIGANGGELPVQPEEMTFDKVRTMDDLVKYNREQKIRTESAQKQLETIGKSVDIAVDKSDKAKEMLPVLDILKQLDEIPETANINTGPYADLMLNAKKFLANQPLTAGFYNQDSLQAMTAAELIQGYGVMLAAHAARQADPNPTVLQFNKMLESNPSLLQTPLGRKTMINIIKQNVERDIELGDAALNLEDRRGWGAVKSHIIRSRKTDLSVTELMKIDKEIKEKQGTFKPSGKVRKFRGGKIVD